MLVMVVEVLMIRRQDSLLLRTGRSQLGSLAGGINPELRFRLLPPPLGLLVLLLAAGVVTVREGRPHLPRRWRRRLRIDPESLPNGKTVRGLTALVKGRRIALTILVKERIRSRVVILELPRTVLLRVS